MITGTCIAYTECPQKVWIKSTVYYISVIKICRKPSFGSLLCWLLVSSTVSCLLLLARLNFPNITYPYSNVLQLHFGGTVESANL